MLRGFRIAHVFDISATDGDTVRSSCAPGFGAFYPSPCRQPVVLGTVGVAHADDAVPAASPTEAAAVIADVVPDVAAEATTAEVTHDADAAMVATTAGTTVDVPRDPAAPVIVAADGGPLIGISIQGGEGAASAAPTDNGTVVYEGTDTATSTVVQATDDGAVRFTSVLSSADAPDHFSYPLTIPDGTSLQLTGEGGAEIAAADGSLLGVVAPAWAVDRDGNPLPTHYELDGTTVTQYVEHTHGRNRLPCSRRSLRMRRHRPHPFHALRGEGRQQARA